MFIGGLRTSTGIASAHPRRTRSCSHLLSLVIGTSLLAVLPCPDAASAQTPEKGVARAVSVQGTVEARQAGATTWQPLQLKDTDAKGGTIPGRGRRRAGP